MSDDDIDTDGLRERLTKQGEDTLGKMADDLLANPIVSGAISRAFEAREKATSVQEATLAALNLPSAADIERLTRRVRSLSQRLEGIEDGLDRIDERLSVLSASTAIEPRLDAIEDRLETLLRELVALRAELPGATEPVPSRQERLKVSS
jgi:chromosome segregation ATPase